MNDEPIDPPVRWLLREIEAHLTPLAYSELLAQFNVHKRRYDRASLLRHTRRELALFERNLQGCHISRRQNYLDKIERRKAKIAQLEAENDSNYTH